MDTSANIIDDYWLMPPMVGEIFKNRVVMLYEQVIKSNLICRVSEQENIIIDINITSKSDNYGPTIITIDIPYYSIYTFTWFFDETCVYKQTINICDEPTKMIFVSCDLLEADTSENSSMWYKMKNEINTNEQICLFHNGDQAYMDKVFNDSIKLIKENDPTDDIKERILNNFGQRYYDTWKPHHGILSHVSNYNLWDDHEIKNNIVLYDDNISDCAKVVRDVAVKAYNLYQRSLSLSDGEFITEYSWYKFMGKLNDVLILGIERTSAHISPFDIITELNKLTNNVMIRKLILCFSGPPIPRPHGNHGNLYNKIYGDMDYKNQSSVGPSTSKFWREKDLSDLYIGLFTWMFDHKHSEVLVVGGDLHFGTYGIVRCGNKEIPVIISSPITNQPTTDRWLASKGMHGQHTIIKNNTWVITFNTISSKARRCYAVVDLKTTPMTVSMHYSDKKIPKHSLKYFKTLIDFM